MQEITVSAPGKLMLVGEWAVLELKMPCIVLAVNKRIEVNIKELRPEKDAKISIEARPEKDAKISIEAKDIGLTKIEGFFKENKIEWLCLNEEDKKKILFSGKAAETTLNYLKEKNIKPKSFAINIKSDISIIEFQGKKEKIGFGSSAAVAVAVSGAILALHGFNIEERKTREIIYKLASITHYFAQGKIGSAFDVAASTFGGALIYERFNSAWLMKELKEKNLAKTVDEEWPDLRIESIRLPADFELCVAFTGKGASTKDLVAKINEFKKNNEKEYLAIMNAIKQIVEQMTEAIKRNDKRKMLELVKENRLKLRELSNKSMVVLETRELTKLIEIAAELGAAGKFSGAGGGDNGIAICFDAKIKEKLLNEWKKAALTPIEVEVDEKGIKKESSWSLK